MHVLRLIECRRLMVCVHHQDAVKAIFLNRVIVLNYYDSYIRCVTTYDTLSWKPGEEVVSGDSPLTTASACDRCLCRPVDIRSTRSNVQLPSVICLKGYAKTHREASAGSREH